MNFLLTNPELDLQISRITKQIKLSMDGIISDSMKDHGINYKKNYGVSIIRIREIAGNYEKSHDLAQRLWLLNIRETMILATLLQPVNTFTRELAADWLIKCDNIELIEQTCMNLYQNLPFATAFGMESIYSGNLQHNIFGFSLLLRIYKQLTPVEIEKIMDYVEHLALPDTEMSLYNIIANCLSRIARKDSETAHTLYNRVKAFESGPSSGKKHIFEMVKQELIFLNYLNEKF